MDGFPPSRSSSLATNGRYPRFPGQQTHGSSYPFVLDRMEVKPLTAELGVKGEENKSKNEEDPEPNKDGGVLRRLRKRSTSNPAPPDPTGKSPSHQPHLSQKTVITTTSSSVYPPSTSSSDSPPSPTSLQTPGPPSPSRLHMTPHLAESTDDVAFRLQLLVKNNYYLPPAHAKPNLSPSTPDANGKPEESGLCGKKKNLGALFKRSKGRTPQKAPSLPEFRTTDPLQFQGRDLKRKPVPRLSLEPPAKPFAQSTSLPPSPRIVVLREPLPDIAAAVKASEAKEEVRRLNLPQVSAPRTVSRGLHDSYFDLDPTSVVDIDPSLTHQVSNLSADGMGGAVPPEDISELFNNSTSTGEDENWRRALLQSAVGLSLSDMSGSLNGKQGRGWHSAEQSTSSDWPSSGHRTRSASAAGITRNLIPSRVLTSSASSVRSAMSTPRSPLSFELPIQSSAAVPVLLPHLPTPRRKAPPSRKSTERRRGSEEHPRDDVHPSHLSIPKERVPSRGSTPSITEGFTGGQSPTIPTFNAATNGGQNPQAGSPTASLSATSSRYVTAHSSQPLTPSIYLRRGAYGSTPSLHSHASVRNPSPTPPASLHDYPRNLPKALVSGPPPPPRHSFQLPVPELTPAPRWRNRGEHARGRRSAPAEEKILPWTKTLPLAEFSPGLMTGGNADQAALKQWGSTPAFGRGMNSMPSAESVSSASVYSEVDTQQRRSQVESSVWSPGDNSFSIHEEHATSLGLVPPGERREELRYSMDTFGGGRGSARLGSISFLSLDEHSSSAEPSGDNAPGRSHIRISSTFGDGGDRASTVAGSSYHESGHSHSEQKRIDIPTPVAFFDAVEAQHHAKHFNPIEENHDENDSLDDYEPSEAGTEDIEAALRDGTVRPLGLSLGHLQLADEHFNASRTELSPEEDIRSPSLLGQEQIHESPTDIAAPPSVGHSSSSHGSHGTHQGNETPEATPTMPYLYLDRTKPITNLSTPRRTFFKDDKSRDRDLSLTPGTSDNIRIKGEVIPQETFEKLIYGASGSNPSLACLPHLPNRPSTSAYSVVSANTFVRPKTSSSAPSIYSRDSASRSKTKLVGDDEHGSTSGHGHGSGSSHGHGSTSSHGHGSRPSPTNMNALDGMVAMHLEAEKERLKRIAKGVKDAST